MPYYPDASHIFEEIDRFGLGGNARNNLLNSKADFDFYRPAPSGGYRKGLPANQRTDVGDGDIPNETWGEDFFTYAPLAQQPAMSTLARLTNMVQRALADGTYAGAIWLEGSTATEESVYWLNLLIDTTVPIVGNSSQRTHGMLSNDGDRNIVDSGCRSFFSLFGYGWKPDSQSLGFVCCLGWDSRFILLKSNFPFRSWE